MKAVSRSIIRSKGNDGGKKLSNVTSQVARLWDAGVGLLHGDGTLRMHGKARD
jgi:hypothetical protein